MTATRMAFEGFGAGASISLRQIRMAGSSQRLSGTGQPPPPGINCQATQDGGAICSEGTGFSPTCPKKPNPNVPGVAQYRQEGNLLIPIPPPPPGAAPAAGGTPTAPVAPTPAVQQNFAAGACPLAAAMAQMPSGGVAAPIAPAVAPVAAAPVPTAPYGGAPLPPPPPTISPVAAAYIASEVKEKNILPGLFVMGGLAGMLYLILTE